MRFVGVVCSNKRNEEEEWRGGVEWSGVEWRRGEEEWKTSRQVGRDKGQGEEGEEEEGR